ncbi:MAG: filamentous hemagglutinin N-terminal domain-containing protein [Cyanothece sp. SIO1E1]|nr:filamentous hemagglutinin N-terminal domain-containing protein [Cyanothece sp. SIO1E1]
MAYAQVIGDVTVSTNVTTPDNLNFIITGGSQVGGNLFQSFSEFSVPEGGVASFENALDVQNIINRVTGNSISQINGLIQAQGSSNFFLVNPNGIVFGPEAELVLGGSFVASTAESLQFLDGTVFSTVEPQAQPLLTMSVPVGLQFGEMPGSIINRSQATRSIPGFASEVPVGLGVQPGQTLALVGGDIFIENGRLSASGGRIELGSVANQGFVSLNSTAKGLTLGFESIQNFQDVQLSQAFVDVSSLEGSGTIEIHGRQIALKNTSQIGAFNGGVNAGGTLLIAASESVEINNSFVTTTTVSSGAAGDIIISTGQLIVSAGSGISALTEGSGQGANAN